MLLIFDYILYSPLKQHVSLIFIEFVRFCCWHSSFLLEFERLDDDVVSLMPVSFSLIFEASSIFWRTGQCEFSSLEKLFFVPFARCATTTSFGESIKHVKGGTRRKIKFSLTFDVWQGKLFYFQLNCFSMTLSSVVSCDVWHRRICTTRREPAANKLSTNSLISSNQWMSNEPVSQTLSHA